MITRFMRTLASFALVASANATPLTVVVDAGHSPSSPGALSASGFEEHAFNLQATNLLALALEQRGVHVIRTGHDGAAWPLKSRAQHAKGAHLFVSVHHDSIQQQWLDQGKAVDFSGFAVFVSARNPHSQKSIGCARSIGTAMREVGEKPSLYHAAPVKGENRTILDKANGVHQFDDLLVLKTSPAPAVLLEVGVIVNPHEEGKLADARFVSQYANAVAVAIVRCLASTPKS